MPKKVIEDITQRIKKAIKNPKSVIFVCTGNTCRSPMAEMILKAHLKEKELNTYLVESRGLCVTEPDMNPLAKEALAQLGIKYSKHEAKQLDIVTVTDAYRVICMEKSHKDTIERVIGEADHVITMDQITSRGDIPDPYGPDFSRYIETAKALQNACDMILENLTEGQDDQDKPKQKPKKTKKKKGQDDMAAPKTENEER